ncbi:membrane protein [Persicobacter psychrovividus]|uniref:Membrane protein n=2 Tax=Persicobacter psychrovividus TaxID=387638 RepID=A0ABM7VBB8_9BACT|nr:membrane protein [Persicobacter psychrovividus]
MQYYIIMSKKRISVVSLVLLWIACSFQAAAQMAQTPYSSMGIGSLNPQGFASNQGKAGVGIAQSSPWFINNLNPALLSNVNLTLIEVGGSYDGRTVHDEQYSQFSGSGNLSYISIAFPIMAGKWTMNFGFNPYSNINYRINQGTSPVMTGPLAPDGSAYIYRSQSLQGEGGLRTAYWSNGVRLNKNFSIGLKASYLFGFYTREQISSYRDERAFDLDPSVAEEAFRFSYLTAYQDKISVSDLAVQLGGRYRGKIGEKKWLNIGLTYDVQADLSGSREIALERRVSTGNPYAPEVIRQPILDDPGYTTDLPAKLGVGLAFEKEYKYSIALDFTQQDWSNHLQNSGSDAYSLGNAYKLALGGEFTPDMFSVRSYFSRVAYRAGLSFEQTPYLILNDNGGSTNVTEMAVSAGASFPVGYNFLSVAGAAGVRDGGDNAFRENYFQITLGVTFSERWFIRRKYD